MRLSRRCWVSGRVQGVFFRATTREYIHKLGLEGTAMNLSDGRVEVHVSGEDEQVEELCRWLWQGPPLARVDDVACEELADEN